ncbi:nitroreductase family protein [Maribellus sp. YY47]|uniref:nitroreductase family protein n=1 Tax=Maribellus sp. YY47 TaxID=2929486 RepID=UPI002001BF5F|nr:nitroreductase family protein [Maribellus sp. YY47]MCK3685195.1 nitroreductase family protein [Maribellus sp. YY47]
MELSDVIQQRFSVRKFKSQAVEQQKLLQILDAGRLAPSAVNFQPWHFIVVEKEVLVKLYSVYPAKWLQQAPLVIVVCSVHSQSWKRGSDGKDSADIDAAIAIDHMTLMATSLGLGTCWICNFNVNRCSELLKLPGNVEPVALLPVGYPDTEAPEKQRKSLEEIVHYQYFGQKLA